jgi:hypothetical protein
MMNKLIEHITCAKTDRNVYRKNIPEIQAIKIDQFESIFELTFTCQRKDGTYYLKKFHPNPIWGDVPEVITLVSSTTKKDRINKVILTNYMDGFNPAVHVELYCGLEKVFSTDKFKWHTLNVGVQSRSVVRLD